MNLYWPLFIFLAVSYVINRLYLYKKHDATFEKMNFNEVLEIFSKQEASN